ncbi:F-box domain-containing protein [Mycena chlorophos]|uniref:F-box domain-containing protein n=1 Tax=Mycena chlorophos TaxID=658473 RepID=A0A8H6W290_MYCCL|nr:F-box domain-containing protein [Mycena chlorophos]
MPKRNESNSELYSRLLFSKKLGYALYNPRLSEDHPRSRLAAGVSVGDVGVVKHDGGFDPLFNVLDPSLNPTNLPEGFKPIATGLTAEQRKNLERQPGYYPPGHRITNRDSRSTNWSLNGSVDATPLGAPVGANAEATYTYSAKETAILELPDGGSVYEHRSLLLLEEHARNNAVEWYTVAAALGRKVRYGDLYLVTQVRQAPSWRRRLGSRVEGNKKFKLGLNGAALGSGELSLERSHDQSPVGMDGEASSLLSTRSYPSSKHQRAPSEKEKVDDAASLASSSPGLPENQTVFFSGFKIMLGLNARLELTARVRDISDDASRWGNVKRGARSFWHLLLSCLCCGGRIGQRGGVETIKNHPSDAINEKIVQEHQDAEAAVTHDCIWVDVLQDGEELPPPPYDKLVQTVMSKYKIVRDANGRLSPCPQGDQTIETLARALAQAESNARSLAEALATARSMSSLDEVLTSGTGPRPRPTRSVRTVSFSQSVLLDREKEKRTSAPVIDTSAAGTATPLESPISPGSLSLSPAEGDHEPAAQPSPVTQSTGTGSGRRDMPGAYIHGPDDADDAMPPPVPPKRTGSNTRRARSGSMNTGTSMRTPRTPVDVTDSPISVRAPESPRRSSFPWTQTPKSIPEGGEEAASGDYFSHPRTDSPVEESPGSSVPVPEDGRPRKVPVRKESSGEYSWEVLYRKHTDRAKALLGLD